MEKLKFISSYSELFAFCTWLPHVFFPYPFLCLPLPPTPILCMAMCFSGLFCTISDSSVWVLMPPSMLLWQPVFFLFTLVCKWVFLVNASFSTVSFLRGETLPALSLCSQRPVWYLSCASWLWLSQHRMRPLWAWNAEAGEKERISPGLLADEHSVDGSLHRVGSGMEGEYLQNVYMHEHRGEARESTHLATGSQIL